MGERVTETFEPYRPDSSYDLEYDDEPQPGGPGRVLWGRVAILGAALLIAFLIGRATGGGDGVPQSDYDEVVADKEALQDDVADLEQRLITAEQQATAPPATASPGTAAGGEDEEATDPEGETEGGETYVVEAGDTLASIAADQYGDASLDDYLAEANGITDPESLAVGQELVIPPKPEE